MVTNQRTHQDLLAALVCAGRIWFVLFATCMVTQAQENPTLIYPTATRADYVQALAASSPQFKPFGSVTLTPAFDLNGQGSNVDSIAFWEASNPAQTLMLVTAKDNQLIEVWQYPFVNRELTSLTHHGFGSSAVNGIAIDQEGDHVYISVSAPASTVSVFSLPQLQFSRSFIAGTVNLRSEPNIALLKHSNEQLWAYVSADTVVYVHNALTGEAMHQFQPARGVETMVADHFYQVIYIPDENDRTGMYAYNPDGTLHRRNGTHRFGSGVFDSDAEGIVLYTCPSDGSSDNGHGFIVVSDQRSNQTEFEFFHRQTWAHLGTLRLEGVSNTDGVASTQQALPDYPLGLIAAINDDTSTVGLGWQTIFQATGFNCGMP